MAAWVVREAGSLWLYASNQSPYPVYQVNVQIGTTGAGTFALECLPPGPPHRLTEIEASHIRHFDPALAAARDPIGSRSGLPHAWSVVMAWIDHCIWWHVYPLGFTGAPIREPDLTPGPRLRQLLNWLDYAVELGVSGLLLGPIFTSQTHGYDTLDFFRVDPRLGTEQDLDDLIAACQARGLRILLDGVFNHVGVQHPFVAQALAAGPGQPSMVVIDWDGPDGPRPATFEGHGSLVEFDHSQPAVADYLTEVMSFWLARGIDGWRLDAAYSVDTTFWATVLPRVRAKHPHAWFLGEVIHGDYATFVAASTVDTVTQYELWKAIWSSLHERNFFELDWTLGRHNTFLDAFTPATFIGNHDVTRIASIVGADLAPLALVVLMTVGGIPSIYYGDERGLLGLKEERLGGDDAVRPAFPDQPSDVFPDSAPAYRLHQDLIGLRRRHPWLVTARTGALELTNTRYVYRSVAADASVALTVELDLTDSPTATVRDDAGSVLWRFDG